MKLARRLFDAGFDAGFDAAVELLRSEECKQKFQTGHQYDQVTFWGPKIGDWLDSLGEGEKDE